MLTGKEGDICGWMKEYKQEEWRKKEKDLCERKESLERKNKITKQGKRKKD